MNQAFFQWFWAPGLITWVLYNVVFNTWVAIIKGNLLFVSDDICKSCNSQLSDKITCFEHFNNNTRGSRESLLDFIAFSTADIVPCVIIGDDPLLNNKFVFIRENNGSLKSLNLSFIGLLTTSCHYASDKKRNVSFTAEKISKIFKSELSEFRKGCLPQNLLSSLMNTLSQMIFWNVIFRMRSIWWNNILYSYLRASLSGETTATKAF